MSMSKCLAYLLLQNGDILNESFNTKIRLILELVIDWRFVEILVVDRGYEREMEGSIT